MSATAIVRKVGPAVALLGLLAALLVWQHAGQSGPPVTPLIAGPAASAAASPAANYEPLRTAFNRDTGKVRILLLIDPT